MASVLKVLAVGLIGSGCGGESGFEGPTAALYTTQGEIVLGLYAEGAPLTVENFLAYVEVGFYDGLIFHRVVPGFMIQAGAYEPELQEREPDRPYVRNESDGGLSNLRGTISMARTQAAHSAQAQFFINLVDNLGLDHEGQGPGMWGYAVFGEVLEGMDAVDRIAGVSTRPAPPIGSEGLPVEAVVIDSARVLNR
jgi:peptidyl-prolyl cis-trans isomerase A (cyclophilin A)/peptidyl-prolyl cis-trans isomerase B (cyclophilin B)